MTLPSCDMRYAICDMRYAICDMYRYTLHWYTSAYVSLYTSLVYICICDDCLCVAGRTAAAIMPRTLTRHTYAPAATSDHSRCPHGFLFTNFDGRRDRVLADVKCFGVDDSHVMADSACSEMFLRDSTRIMDRSQSDGQTHG